MPKKLKVTGHQWLDRVGRINLAINSKRLTRLEAIAERYGLAKEDARSPKVIWKLVDDADNIFTEKERIKQQFREMMEKTGIKKWEL